MGKLQSVLLIVLCAVAASCKKDTVTVTDTSIISVSVDGQSYSSNNITVKKDPVTGELLSFSSLTADSVTIGIQLDPTTPAYQPGAYTFRPSGVNGVLLISFNIASFTAQPMLTWVTSQESTLDHFTVERSADGISFSAVAMIPASTNAADTNTYTFIDTTATAFQKAYYRLKMVNLDGSFSYSAIRTYAGLEDYHAYYGTRSLRYKGFNGTIQVTAHDRTTHVVTGIFLFDFINTAGATQQVRNGSFRILY